MEATPNENITVTLTSCDRVDLLSRTLASFFSLNRYPVGDIYVHNDGTGALFGELMSQYPQIKWLFSGGRIGLSKSWDTLLSKVETEFIFSGEEDWLFDGNRYFIEESLKVMEAHPEVHHVWVRHKKDHGHPLGGAKAMSGVPVQEVLQWGEWNGFSMNPGLRRMSDLRRFFPNGLSEFGDEINCARHTAKFNYKAVALANGACKHIGNNRHTPDFKV